MKKILMSIAASALVLSGMTSCVEDVVPQTGSVTSEQAAAAPGAYNNFVNAITSSLAGSFTYSGNSSTDPYDFGYPSFFLQRDVMGQDIVCENSGSEWYTTWYGANAGLGPTYARCQLPWTYYYGWIKNCNTVLSLAGETPKEEEVAGAGIAYAMRAMFYMDLARMFAPETYAVNPEAETVPIVTEKTTGDEATNNPRATNKDMWAFILSDLDKAEKYLANYKRPDKYTPDLSVVYGLKARAYLTMEDWKNAEDYAVKAQVGYETMNKDQLLNKQTGFNTPNGSWMFGLTYLPTDPNITLNDADSSWGSQMIIEVSESGCGYSANYVGPKRIDAHLFSTIPATDYRRMWWIDPAIDEIEEAADAVKELEAYSDSPEGLANTGFTVSAQGTVGYMPVKFRPKDGEHADQYKAFTVAVPLMRVEEMRLIEAEAAGMQNLQKGKDKLIAFAKDRDPQYKYDDMASFRDQVWWQRRVEFWGEGLATFDMKRLNKGIVRSYAGTNHPKGYRWNTESVPQWMHLCIVQTETNFNTACTNNPTPVAPTEDSAEYTW